MVESGKGSGSLCTQACVERPHGRCFQLLKSLLAPSAAAHLPPQFRALLTWVLTRCPELVPFFSSYPDPGSEGFDPGLVYLIFCLISDLIISSVCKVRISVCLLCLLKPFFSGVKRQVPTWSAKSFLSHWERVLGDDGRGRT